ncbi:hypothetical protein ROZALSC1DRAFT_21750 [Rozella allomycis CSF55]|uniref:Uncharacterized protein n=1 Tax=Rozella allomycis (strain CSF55) TaxID=988480 RepID=A0A4P9YN48_ROZAC|nr:hypothetical protein ROZALSC1DRAFT_21750 [Rozella allomycis CSF55]
MEYSLKKASVFRTSWEHYNMCSLIFFESSNSILIEKLRVTPTMIDKIARKDKIIAFKLGSGIKIQLEFTNQNDAEKIHDRLGKSPLKDIHQALPKVTPVELNADCSTPDLLPANGLNDDQLTLQDRKMAVRLPPIRKRLRTNSIMTQSQIPQHLERRSTQLGTNVDNQIIPTNTPSTNLHPNGFKEIQYRNTLPIPNTPYSLPALNPFALSHSVLPSLPYISAYSQFQPGLNSQFCPSGFSLPPVYLNLQSPFRPQQELFSNKAFVTPNIITSLPEVNVKTKPRKSRKPKVSNKAEVKKTLIVQDAKSDNIVSESLIPNLTIENISPPKCAVKEDGKKHLMRNTFIDKLNGPESKEKEKIQSPYDTLVEEKKTKKRKENGSFEDQLNEFLNLVEITSRKDGKKCACIFCEWVESQNIL